MTNGNSFTENFAQVREYLLSEPDMWYEVLEFDDGIQNGMAFASLDQQNILSTNGSLVLMDSTHKTNIFNMFLFTLYVKDKYNTWLPAGHFLLTNETNDAIAKGLDSIKSRCKNWTPFYFIVDDSGAEQVALEKIFGSEVKVFLCTVHSARTLMRRLAHVRPVYSLMMDSMFTKTKHLCLQKIKQALDVAKNMKNIKKYIQQNWLKDTSKWAMWARQGSLALLQNRSTNAIESYHRLLKKKLKKRDNLIDCIKKIVKVNYFFFSFINILDR